MTPADLTRIWRKTLRAESKGIPSRRKRAVVTAPKNPLAEDGDASGLLEPVLSKGHEADLFERSILDEGLRMMRSWTPEEIIEILEDAATILVTLRADVWCDECSGPVLVPVRDAEEAGWLRSGHTYCSKACLDAHDEHRINAAGNEAS